MGALAPAAPGTSVLEVTSQLAHITIKILKKFFLFFCEINASTMDMVPSVAFVTTDHKTERYKGEKHFTHTPNLKRQ
jgi:hypothetical protein